MFKGLSTPELSVTVFTPPGRGAVATIRLEGPDAARMAAKHFSSKTAQALIAGPANRLLVGRFRSCIESDVGEDVVVRRLPCGAVELHCHAGLAAVAQIEQAFVAAGATRASWQEWIAGNETDPIAAAALVALAEAATPRTAAILVDQYRGALRKAFSEIEESRAANQNEYAQQLAEELLTRAPLGLHLTQPWRVALAGRPNVGKSTLMNALAGYRRAIVHSQPGTTRDIVTLRTAVDGWPVEFCDTAGLHDACDPLERQGMERARTLLETVDLVVLVFDRSIPWTDEDAALLATYPTALMVHSKCDLPPALHRSLATDHRPPVPGFPIRAIDGVGIGELCQAIASRLVPVPPGAAVAIPFLAEHVAFLKQAVMN